MVIISIAGNFKPGMLENRGVVSPGWFGQINHLISGKPLGQEVGADPQTSGSGNALNGDISAFTHL